MVVVIFLILLFLFVGKACTMKANEKAADIRIQNNTDKILHDRDCFSKYIATDLTTKKMEDIGAKEWYLYNQQLPADEETFAARKLRERIWNEAMVQPNSYMITCAMLAQLCLVPRNARYEGFVTTHTEPRVLRSEAELKFLKWWDAELKKNGMTDFELKYIKREDKLTASVGNTRVAQPVKTLEYVPSLGIYFWHHGQISHSWREIAKPRMDYEAPYVNYHNE